MAGRRACPVSCGPRLVAYPGLALASSRRRHFASHRPATAAWPPMRSALVAAMGTSPLLLSRPKALVFLGVRSLGRAQPPLDLGLELRRTLLHALVAHRLVLGGVRLDLRPVERDMAELHKSRLFSRAPLQLARTVESALKCRLRKSETVRKSGGSSPNARGSRPVRAPPWRSGATSRRRCNSRTATAPSSSPGQTAAARARSHTRLRSHQGREARAQAPK